MSKSKPKLRKRWRVKDYIRELSIVVIGVAITLYAGNLINDIKTKRDLKFQLAAIYAELEENLQNVNELSDHYERLTQLRKHLHYHMKEDEAAKVDPAMSIADSIMKYQNTALFTVNFSYKRDAYNVFINNDETKILADKDLLLEISGCYSSLEELKEENDRYIDSKWLVFHEVYRLDKDFIFSEDFNILSPPLNDLFNFHALNSGLELSTQEVKRQIEETLSENRKND